MAGSPLNAAVRFWRDPALPGVEARSSTYTREAFRTHTHRSCIVSLVTAGETRFSLGPSGRARLLSARAGQLAVIPAGAPHACNPLAESGFSYRLIAVAPAWLAAACGSRQAPRFASPVVEDPELFAAWLDLHALFVHRAPAADKQALLLACLRELVRRHAAGSGQEEPAEHPGEHPGVAAARRRVAENPGAFLPLEDLAGTAGLSPHHFLRVFKEATGLPPHAYQLQQAIEHAKELLAGGAPISRAALDAGFADQSHFSRLFRQFTGATPRQYAQAERESTPEPAASPG